ncbi:uncharacterized protein LOC113650435 isoform X2 [Tachysurus fulvidraco]|uniref:uncharacterized protein LOC113650435 isoform X2 n=1 Tax=Tachysurus fulvidraco TaxID=1234273 RepID=UPI001FF02C98|nr:uncharacterized protein LOC113650435 isoform X2 [Tachysurus fulvidraco]
MEKRKMDIRSFFSAPKCQINKTCMALSSGSKYNYTAPILDSLLQNDCELAWKAPNNTVLNYGGFLTHAICETGIRLVAHCLKPRVQVEYVFNVIKSITSPPGSFETSGAQKGFITIIVVLLILLLIGSLFGFTRRERCRDWWRSACRCVFTRAESHNIPLEENEAGSNHEMRPLNIVNSNHDHAVSANQNGDADIRE